MESSMNNKSSTDFKAALVMDDAIACIEIFPDLEQRQFLRGPLDWRDICLAASLPGKCLEVWLLIHLRWRMRKEASITLPNKRLAEMGVDRWAKTGALRELEAAGLIHTDCGEGTSP